MATKTIYDSRYRELLVHICEVRKGRGMTQAELGRRMRLSRQTVQKIESCEVRLDLIRYVTLCRILGLDAGQHLSRLEESSDEDDPLFTYQLISIELRAAFKIFFGGGFRIDFGGHLVATFDHGEGFFGR